MPGRVPRGDLRSGSAWERLSNREAVGSPTTAEAPPRSAAWPSPQTPTVVEPSWSASALSRGKLALSLCHTLAQSPRGSSQPFGSRSEEHTSELQSRPHLVCRLLLEKK